MKPLFTFLMTILFLTGCGQSDHSTRTMTVTIMARAIIITPKVAVTAMTTTPNRNLLPESAWALA